MLREFSPSKVVPRAVRAKALPKDDNFILRRSHCAILLPGGAVCKQETKL